MEEWVLAMLRQPRIIRLRIVIAAWITTMMVVVQSALVVVVE
jgi:hypothetical protein